MTDNDEKRGTEEAYISATATSNLRVRHSDDPLGDADYIAAAGMSSSVVGSCLLRLHSEWSAVEKPRFLSAEEGERLVRAAPVSQVDPKTLKQREGETKAEHAARIKPPTAAQKLAAHYLHETSLLLGKLKSFRAAHAYLTGHLSKWDNRPEPMLRQTSVEVLIWWLDRRCKVCNGTQWETASGTNRHTNRPCRGCKGTGIAKLPREMDGRRLANYIDDCCQHARTSIGARLRR